MSELQAAAGIVVFGAIAWVASENRRGIRWRLVLTGLALQAFLAVVFLRVPWVRRPLFALNEAVIVLEKATTQAAAYMFGYLSGGPLPFEEIEPGSSYIIAFRVLPLILVMSALSALLFHWRVIPWIVTWLGRGVRRAFSTSGTVALGAGASVMFGIIEMPLLVKDYLARMSRGELLALLSCAMATVAGTVMVLYASVVAPVVPDALGHILVASLMSVPAALALSHIMIPVDASRDATDVPIPRDTDSALEAVMKGTKEGTQMVISVAATIVVMFAFVHLANFALALFPAVGGDAVTLERAAGWLFQPLVWLIGIPWAETELAGELMGTKTILNEFVAYLELARRGDALSEPTRTLLLYALCGFANFGSLGIVVGGVGTIMPGRSVELASVGLRAMLVGTLATLTTASMVNLVT